MSNAVQPTMITNAEDKRRQLARLLRERAAFDSLVHRLFEAQVARTPDAVALSFLDVALTYDELNSRANQLAHHLRKLGVGPETLVALCVERSPEMVIGLLGILKAGAAYVPLDPQFPESRLALMLTDACVPVLVTTQPLLGRLASHGERAVCLDTDWTTIGNESVENPKPLSTIANLAYVIYTSGSTGRPKGVQITHGALSNFLLSMRQILGLTSSDTLAAVTTLSFDIAALELYLPLIQGARLELVERATAADGKGLANLLRQTGTTFLQATPATWRLLLDAGWEGEPDLTLLCGGEALPRALADRLLEKGKALWNLYGPTETTIWSSIERVAPGDAPIAIGRPIANTQMYVLDTRLRPVPVGITGELYIGGSGLARGYLNRPGLSAQQFVPDPFSTKPGARLYRTGDLARWLADGRLECLGRIDHQVKVRGFRIELGDIESILLRHPMVREAAVIARPDASGEQALVAYLVTRDDADLAADTLRPWLATQLPDYMIPSAFARLQALPLTPNGKIDRKALPQLEIAASRTAVYVPPRGPVEEAIASILSDLLGLERVGVHDNFFDLGGHSLFATQLMARIRDTFSVEPSLRDFLEDATVATLVRQVENGLRERSGLSMPPIHRLERTSPLPLSFAQQRLWFLDRLAPGSAQYNIPTAVRIQGQLHVAALEAAIREVVRRHEVLRGAFVTLDGVAHQTIAEEFAVPLPLMDLSPLPPLEREAETRRWIDAESARPFDLETGPLLRALLIRLGDDEHILVVTMHHIASDGWSLGVLVRELATLYDAFRAGKPSPLPELAIQYADYAAWQSETQQSPALDYWKAKLQGLPVLELPTDRPRPSSSQHYGGQRTLRLSDDLNRALRALSRQERATTFMTLFAGFATLLNRYSSQADFAVGTPVAGRTRSEFENLIGFFVNTLVLRLDLSGDPSFRSLLRRVRQTSLDAYANQDVRFEQLTNALRPERESAQSPLFQVMFALQNAPVPPLEAPGLTMTPLPAESGTAKFDLSLFVAEDDGGLNAIMEYDATLFEAATVDRMLRHYATLLEGATAAPDEPISTLPMMSEEEHKQILEQCASDDPEPATESLSDAEVDALLQSLTPERIGRSADR